MKVLLSWLRDFVDVPGTAEEIARTMSVRGFAVEGIAPVGDSTDAVIDFEVTGNRPDCMSVIGMAREVATAYQLPLRGLEGGPAEAGPHDMSDMEAGVVSGGGAGLSRPDAAGDAGSTGPALHLSTLMPVDRGDIEVVIENAELCPRYAGAVADVKVEPSPAWLQARLQAAGVRPISNIVDITNYVLLELGHPMHAFDLATIRGGQIRVRAVRGGESLRTLDGQVRSLTPEMLVIADADRPVAIAGVMGGADSEVSAATTTIVLESAYFNPLSVRRTSRKLALKTEASMRFERGADANLPAIAMARACALLEITGAGRARGTVVDVYPREIEPSVLRLRRRSIKRLLGAHVPDADVEKILASLGFALDARPGEHDGGWAVTVPTRRVDVLREVDLIEEIARHYGFDRLPVSFPPLTSPAAALDPRIAQTRGLRTILTGAGFSEAVTFGFIGEAAAAPFAPEGDLVPIANPLSENFGVLRPSVIPGLIAAVAHNRRREQRDVRLFEVGARFRRSIGERRTVACAWTGAGTVDHWGGGARDVDFFDIKGTVERICHALRVEPDTAPHREPWLVAGRTASVRLNGALVGAYGQLAPAIAEAHGLPVADPVYVAEIDLDVLDATASRRPIAVEPLPRFPSVTRDVSILVDEQLAAERVRDTIRAAAPPTLVRVREFDRYQGKGVPDGRVSLSLRLTFRSPDRTLTDADVQSAMDAILVALQREHGAVQR